MAKGKVEKVMHEFKEGSLKSGGGPKVTDRKQAIAIALSEQKKAEHKKHGKDMVEAASQLRKKAGRGEKDSPAEEAMEPKHSKKQEMAEGEK